MERKRITQLMPWLLPLRKMQRKLFFYTNMFFDSKDYSKTAESSCLPYLLFESKCEMYNKNTGCEMKYQENKVYNLKLAAEKLDGLVIRSGECFSFWQVLRYADKERPYKDALAEIDGKLVAEYGGGLCMMSNLLFWLFLHSPMKVTERKGHGKKDFPEPPSDAVLGVDATVAEGWIDLKAENTTDYTFQIKIDFDDEHIIGRIYSDRDTGLSYKILNKDLNYFERNGKIFEQCSIVRQTTDRGNKDVTEELLYKNLCEINYELPLGTEIKRGEQ